MSENSPLESHYPPLVRPEVFITPANPPSSHEDIYGPPVAPLLAAFSSYEGLPEFQEDIYGPPVASLLAAFSSYEGLPEFQKDIYGPVAPSLATSSNYEELPTFREVTASQSSLLSSDQAIPMHEFPHQLLGMDMQPLSATRSTQPLPPFHPIQRMYSMDSTTSISDGTSDAHTHRSGSILQHSIISSTMNPRRRHPNPKQTHPALRDYQGTKTFDILVLAKATFTAAAFSTGLFFYHKHSPHIDTFRTMSLDIFTHTAQKKDCSDIQVDDNHVTILLSTLGTIRGTVKKEARFIVEKQYHLLEINNHQ